MSKGYEGILSAMQEEYSRQSGFDADSASDIGIRLRVLAAELSRMYESVSELERQIFPQTSTGAALERHAECRRLTRKSARKSEGELLFSREQPAPGDIMIEAGTICATGGERQIQFETTESRVMPQGATEISVPARAVESGENGNVMANTVRFMVTAAAGISSVVNAEAFTGGMDAESDDDLRERLLEAYKNISNGTNSAFYYDMAMQSERVKSAAVLPRVRGRGTVDVVVDCAGSGETVTAELQAEMNRRKEINVDVLVYEAEPRSVNLTLKIAPRQNTDYDSLAETCAAAAEEYINNMAVGQPLLTAHLTAHLLGIDGVYNLRTESPSADIYPASNEVLRSGTVTAARRVRA